MRCWLMKSEPEAYSWDRLVAEGRTFWEGVRNHQANNNMKAMAVGDRAFFYHSGATREIVGVMEVIGAHRPDPSDATAKFGMVEVKPLMAVKQPVTLAAVKAEPKLAELALVRHTRLSVMPVEPDQWRILCRMAGIKA